MIGLQPARHALDRDHGLLQQDQFGPQPHVEQGGDLEQLAQEPAHRHLAGGAADHRLADRAQSLGESFDRMVRRDVAGLEMHARNPVVVAADEAPQDLGQIAPLSRSQPPHDAEVDGGQMGRRAGEQIALVQVGVEHPVVQRLDQEGAHDIVGQLIGVDARQVQQRRIRHRHALRPFQRQHALADAVPDHGRGGHISVLGQHLGHLAGGGGLQPHVQLQIQRVGDGFDEGGRLQPPRHRHEPPDQPRGQPHRIQAIGDPPLDARPQHLDCDGSPVGQGRAVRLGQGGGSDRRAEVDEQAFGRPTQRLLDLTSRLFQREGRQGVLQPAKVARELQPEDVGARGQNLAQFDRHGAQMFERLAQPLARPTLTPGATGEQLHEPGKRPRPGRQKRRNLPRDQGVMTRQDPQPAQQAQEGRNRVLDRDRRGRRRGRAIDPAGQIAHP